MDYINYIYIYFYLFIIESYIEDCLENYDNPLGSEIDNGVYYIRDILSLDKRRRIDYIDYLPKLQANNVTLARSIQIEYEFHSCTVLGDH